MKRVGFIINSRVPQPAALIRGMPPHALLTGWDDSGSPMSFMRFRWIAAEVNRGKTLRYELYKPWRRYDAVVFLKSMGAASAGLMMRLRRLGTRVVFEANVDYYTIDGHSNLPGDLAPHAAQREQALCMTRGADAVIASSTHLAGVCRTFAEDVTAVPDNIAPSLVPQGPCGDGRTDGRLNVWWSGMAPKAYDLLLIKDVLAGVPVHLHLVTGDLESSLQRWPEDRSREFREMLSRVAHTVHRYRDVADLMRLYHSAGGVIVSPRYLDSPYNLSHTEWKVTLGLACGLAGLASPQPSYLEAADVSGGQLQICRDAEEWRMQLNSLLQISGGSCSGAEKILRRYGSPSVAGEHSATLERLLA